jgi:hypothetical protein
VNDIVMLKMDDDQTMEVDIVLKVMMMLSDVEDMMNERFQTKQNLRINLLDLLLILLT